MGSRLRMGSTHDRPLGGKALMITLFARRAMPAVGFALLSLLTATGALTARAEGPAARTLGTANWTDIQGKKYGQTEVAQAKATVFLFASTQCPLANQYT